MTEGGKITLKCHYSAGTTKRDQSGRLLEKEVPNQGFGFKNGYIELYGADCIPGVPLTSAMEYKEGFLSIDHRADGSTNYDLFIPNGDGWINTRELS